VPFKSEWIVALGLPRRFQSDRLEPSRLSIAKGGGNDEMLRNSLAITLSADSL